MESNVSRKIGDCESCDLKQVPIRPLGGNLWLCDACHKSEIDAQTENNSPENVKARMEKLEKENIEKDMMNRSIREAQRIDGAINIRTDLFNAATVSIVNLKASIDADESIVNKPYTLAEQLIGRFNHFKSVVFELNQKIVEAGNEQKAIQVYLNQLSNSLREEERNKLKLADINYKPTTPKVPSIKTTTKMAPKKLDKVELRKYAAELGVSEFTLQMIVVQKGLTVEAAARMLRHSINEAKS